jgi:hypothetical protein
MGNCLRGPKVDNNVCTYVEIHHVKGGKLVKKYLKYPDSDNWHVTIASSIVDTAGDDDHVPLNWKTKYF